MHFKTQPLLFVLLLILLISVPGFAQQSVKDAKVTIKARDASLIEVLEEIERQTGFTFFYKTTAETESPVNLEFTNTSLEKVLYELSRR
ncbi:MAG: hypothetical protein KI790_19895, partial [Cyclobacteriaceae bacterium]|nr:hypothetical protein [Cyclobacteriaceae bacterium HetDA_MAG_MS6]